MALFGGVAATATTALATGDAGAAMSAAHAAPHGIQIALSHVPSASNAYGVLKEHLSLIARTGIARVSGAGGIATTMKHSLQAGLGK